MVFLSRSICVCILIFFISPVYSKQPYDMTNCSSESQVPGSNYFCSSDHYPCDTFIIYRAQQNFQSLSSIASLFNLSSDNLLHANNMTESESNSSNIRIGQEIIIPITCSCTDEQFSQAIFMYNISGSESFTEVACGVFEGLVKAQSLAHVNPDINGSDHGALTITIPIRCACPTSDDKKNGVNFLLTYPIIEKDEFDIIAKKFGVVEDKIYEANSLESVRTIFPETTMLIPLNDPPVVNRNVQLGNEDPASPRGVVLDKVTSGNRTTLETSAIVSGLILVVLALMLSCILICIRRTRYHRRFEVLTNCAISPNVSQSLSPKLSPSLSPKLSPDFLDGVYKLKHTVLENFSLEKLRTATDNFSEASVIGTTMYRGRLGGSYVAIEKVNSEDAARRVIDILTKINHLNVVRLVGCCYRRKPYLVFEFAENGSLRDCLSNTNMSRQLTWVKRMHIAFDLAVAIYYIHFCTKPAYIHRNINSRNVLITKDWRVKISGFRLAKPVTGKEENENMNWNESVIVGKKGYLAPEYLSNGLASFKVDVFAYGIVLLELLSGREVTVEGKLLQDSVSFLVDSGLEGSSGYLDKLHNFLDPALEGSYPVSDAICLTLLATACTEKDPNQRPTMNDVLKAISRMF